jgi:hypothetical protein
MAKVNLPNCVQVRVQGKSWMAASVIVSTQFGVSDLAHCFGDHLCLCGILFEGI